MSSNILIVTPGGVPGLSGGGGVDRRSIGVFLASLAGAGGPTAPQWTDGPQQTIIHSNVSSAVGKLYSLGNQLY